MTLPRNRGALTPTTLQEWMRQFALEPRWMGHSLSDEPFLDQEWSPAVDVKEDDKAYLVDADIPGVAPKDIEITLENGVLTIRGQRQEEKREEKENFHRIERFSGTFSRRFTLPDAVDSEGVKADMKKGVLKIRIPKREKAVSRRIEIKS